MNSIETLMTADDLLLLPDDGRRHELLEGELRSMTPAGSEHGMIALRLAARVFSFVEYHDLGVVFTAKTGFKIASDPDTVRAPDLAFVRRERIPESGVPTGYWPGAPDLAVEVISPGDTYEEVEEKVAQWLRSGTLLVWIVNPRHRTVAVRTSAEKVRILSATDDLLGGEILSGFRCAVSELFP